MQRDSIRKVFDQQAATYDQQWSRLAPLNEALHLLMGALFSELPPGELERIRTAYNRDVAVLPPAQVEDIIESGGFEPPTPFYQAGLVRGWYATRC